MVRVGMSDACFSAYLSGASEGHFVQVHVSSNGRSGRGSVPRQDVDNARGKASLEINIET